MTESNPLNPIIEYWGKPNESILRRRKIIRISIISFIAVIVLLLAFLSVYNFTDLIYKPDTNLSSNPNPGDWAMFGRDIVHGGNVNAVSISLTGAVKTLLATGGPIESSPAVANGVIYVGSRDGNLYAIDATSGAKRWEFKTGSWIESSPAIVNNIVYIGSNDGNLYALDASTGKKLWQYQGRYPIKSSPAIAGNMVYVGSDDYNVYALDASTGREIWRVEAGDVVSSSPVIANGLVFFGSWDANFYALDAKSGRLHLRMPATRSVTSSPIVVGDTIYLSNSQGLLLAIDGKARNWPFESRIRPEWEAMHIYGIAPLPPAASGYLWSFKLGAGSDSSPTIANDILYIGSGKKVIAVDTQSRKKLWEFETGGAVNSTPVVVNNVVYVASGDGHLYLLNASSGDKLKDIPVSSGAAITSNPAIAGGTVFISSTDGNLYAVN